MYRRVKVKIQTLAAPCCYAQQFRLKPVRLAHVNGKTSTGNHLELLIFQNYPTIFLLYISYRLCGCLFLWENI